MCRLAFVFPVALCSLAMLSAQQNQPPPAGMPAPDAPVPAEAAKQPNPVKSSPESLARAQKWWSMDCTMCHDKDGDGKGEVAISMKLTIADFRDPATLKDRTDGELFYIIKTGRVQMPAEGDRVKTDELWGLVNYVRSLAKAKPEPAPKP
jgi:mono/diheme cytochrome c family protein